MCFSKRISKISWKRKIEFVTQDVNSVIKSFIDEKGRDELKK